MNQNDGEDDPSRLRNRLAQTRHREKRRLAEKENAAMKRRIRELELELAKERQWRTMAQAQGPRQWTGHLAMPQGTESAASFTQSHPAAQLQTLECQPNLHSPQMRMCRSLSVSSCSIGSQSSYSGHSFASNIEDYCPPEEYIPNCQKLVDLGIESVGNSLDLDLSIGEYLDFGGNGQLPGGNGQQNSVQPQALQAHEQAMSPAWPNDLQPASCSLDPFGLEECDMITPLASRLFGGTANGFTPFEDPDLVTPRPRTITD